MVFENLKAYFSRKKQFQVENIWFMIEFMNDTTIHIIDQKMLEILLVDTDNSLQALMSCGWTRNLGWHEGNDGKIYERHTLSDAGNDYYNKLNYTRNVAAIGPKYIKVLNKMNAGKQVHYDDNVELYMCVRMENYFKKNSIKSIKKYNREELEQEKTKQVSLR